MTGETGFLGDILNITVNGEEKQVEEGTKVTELLKLLDVKPERLAVELNRCIIRRADWPHTVLAEGDRIEIVHFVGGGSLAETGAFPV